MMKRRNGSGFIAILRITCGLFSRVDESTSNLWRNSLRMLIRLAVGNASIDGKLMEPSKGIQVIYGFLSSEIVLSLLVSLVGNRLLGLV
jgi:hypothetical protein